MTTSDLPSLSFSHEEDITIAPLHASNVVNVRLEATTVLRKPRNSTTTTTTTPFPSLLLRLLENFDISRLFLQTGSSSTSSYMVENSLHDEYSTGPSGISVIVELQDARNQLESLLQALQDARVPLLAPLSAALQQDRLHRHAYTTKTASGGTARGRMLVILPCEGSAVALEGVRAFMMSGNNVCCGTDQGLFSTHYSSIYSNILLGIDSKGVVVSQQSRRSMWMDVQSSCNSDGNSSSEDACTITLKRGLQYGIVLPTQRDEQAETTTTIPLSKLLPFTDSSFRDCCTSTLSSSNNKKKKTTLHVLSSTRNDKDESTVVHEDWNVDTTVIEMDLPKPSPSSLDDDTTNNEQQQQQLSANRILWRPNGVANSGSIVTRIQSSLECPVTVQVVEILPPILMPLWDTWTLTTTQTRPLLSPQSDGTIVVEYNVTVPQKTEIQVSLDYEPVLLPFQQFPADPNRGIELPSTLFTFQPECDKQGNDDSSFVTLYSSPLLFMPPVPDMSMPFNVISLTCTLYAFVIGSLCNLMVRKASRRIQLKLHPEQEKSKLQKLKEKLCSLVGQFKRNTTRIEEEVDNVNNNSVGETTDESEDNGDGIQVVATDTVMPDEAKDEIQ